MIEVLIFSTMKPFLHKHLPIVALIMLIITYQYVIVTRWFLVAMGTMKRNEVFDLIERFIFVWVGTDIMLYILLPIATLWSLIVSLENHGWKKVFAILILLFIFLYRFDLIIMPIYFFDR